MKSRVKFLKAVFYAPAFVALLRILLTLFVIIWNPMNMPLRFIQIFPMCVLICSVFVYMKLYSDGDPVISLMVPTIAHILIIFAFQRELVIIPFVPILLLDAIYLVLKGIKASAFPFEVEGEENAVDEYDDLEVGEE